jgi:hypothetical protein
MITTLKIVISFDILGLEENYQGTYFGLSRLVNMLQ